LDELATKALIVLRKNANLLMILFKIVCTVGLPELTSSKDIEFIRDHLVLDKSPEEVKEHFKSLMKDALSNKLQQINDFGHVYKHFN
jgi:phosphatidylinositol-4,5-bisphosphate 3-kinase catalytic subunit alpha/beta/delta